MQEYFPLFSNVFLQLSKDELILHFKNVKCFLHFGNAGIFPAFSNVFLQLSIAELLLHFKNVEVFPTFWKCRNISHFFPMSFCSCQKMNCSYILKMQKCFLHFGKGGIFPAIFQMYFCNWSCVDENWNLFWALYSIN